MQNICGRLDFGPEAYLTEDLKLQEEAQEQAQQTVERARRKRMLMQALVSYNHEFSSMPCVIRDLSDSGARLSFEDTIELPSSFVLHVELLGLKATCRKVRQENNVIGVTFVGAVEYEKVHQTQMLKPSYDAVAEHRDHEAELRQSIAELRRKSFTEQVAAETTQPVSAVTHKPARVFGKRH